MRSAVPLFSLLITVTVWASDYPAPVEGDWVVHDFRFHTGETLPELRLHYRTVGQPTGEPILLLHGTNNTSATFISAQFAGELFRPGQPLDASRHYIILPDAVGAGNSSKPSNGMRTKFPHYNYDDIVRAQYRLVTEHLGVKHLKRIIGNRRVGCKHGSGARRFPTSWMPLCRWHRSLLR